jgi:NAD-dependent deacetylase
MDEIWPRLRSADVFCAIGTSGVVYPAAGFGEMAASYGARTVELNIARGETAPWFDDVRTGPATELVPAWVDELVSSPAAG